MLNTAISLLGLGFNYVNSIQIGKKFEELLSISIQHGLQFEKLSDSIYYLVDNLSVLDIKKREQKIVRNYRTAREILHPIQKLNGLPLISSSIIETPEKMKNCFLKNPYEVLINITPIKYTQESSNSNLIPIIFEDNNQYYVGWQMKGKLPFLLNCRYENLIPKAGVIDWGISRKIKIHHFNHFLGLCVGDTIEEAFKLFGKPNRIEENKRIGLFKKSQMIHYYYANDEVTIICPLNNKKIKSIEIKPGILRSNFIKKEDIDLDISSIFSKNRKAILGEFGHTTMIHKDLITYTSEKVWVTFFCDKNNKSTCYKINMQWQI